MLNSGWMGVDLSQYDLDEPLGNIESNAIQSTAANLSAATGEDGANWTVRDIAEHTAIGGLGPVAVGSGATIAQRLIDIQEQTDVDGFNLAYAVTPGTWEDVIEFVVPELRARGAYPEEYVAGSLRQKLFGRAGPAPRGAPCGAVPHGGPRGGLSVDGHGATYGGPVIGTTFVVRTATGADADAACVDLWVAAVADRDGLPASPAVRERARTKFAADRVALVVADDPAGAPVGFALVTAPGTGGTPSDAAYLSLLAVAPTAQGQRAGPPAARRSGGGRAEAGHAQCELHALDDNARRHWRSTPAPVPARR